MNIEVVVESRRTILSGSFFSGNSCTMDALHAAETRELRGLVIADTDIEDAAVLLEQLKPGTELWLLDSRSVFADTLHDALSGGYDNLHFVGHGQPGSITLGGKVLEAEDFTALTGADVDAPSIHFWSCMTGAGSKGRAFVHRIAEAFGTVVTAFTNLVGAGNKGGGWLPDVFSGDAGLVAPPFMNTLAYAHTLQASALKLISVVTATGVDVQVRLTAGTVIDNADFVLSYDSTKASYTGAIGNPALTGWTWASNPDSENPGHLLISGISTSFTPINSTSDIVLARISFTLQQGSTEFGASLASETGLGLGNSSVGLGTLPTLDTIIFSSVPVWETFTPPGELSYAPGATIALDFPVHATDPNGETITYKASVGQMVGTTFFGVAGVPQIPLTLSNGHLTGSTTVPLQAAAGSYVLRLLADDNTTDTNNGAALDVPFSVTSPDIKIDVNGLPASTPVRASYEMFMDFVLDPAQQNVPGYLASFKVDEDSKGNPVYAYLTDTNKDGMPDHVTDGSGTGTITWSADGIWYFHPTSVTGIEDHYGRFAYDATGDGGVVGLYGFDLTPYTLVPDTNSSDKLVSTFKISSTETGKLYDDDGNGVIDRMKDVETWTDQSGQSHTNTNNYQLTWTDAVHWTAHYTEAWTFGSTYDDNGRPATLWFDGSEHTIAWQTKGNDNIVATVNFNTQQNGVTVPAVLSLIDSNADNKPDQVMYTDGTVTEYANLVGWTFDANNRPIAVNIVVTSDTSSKDLFSGVAFGSSSNLTTILLPSSNDVSNITINTTGLVGGTPLPNESYNKFHSGTGVLATAGDNGFSLNLTNDNDNNPLTFNASWSWLNSSGQITQTSTGVLTFQDTDTTKAGPEQWSGTFNRVDTGVLVADGADADTLPDGFVVGDNMGNYVTVPLVWQTKDTNNVVATFTATVKNSNNSDITFSGVLKDTNSDTKPDTLAGTWGTQTFNLPFSFTDSNNDGTPDHWRMVESQTQSGRVQVDASGNPAGLYLANSNNSGITIDFNGSPTGTPASYEVFLDFYQSTPTTSITGYQASFQSIWKDALGVSVTSTWGVFDTNGDGIGDSYTETYTHAGTQTNNSGTIIWSANGIFYSHQTAGDMATAEDIYGRLAYDAQGGVVGLYAFHLTPYTLVSDTNPDDKLISTFTISSTETVKLFDDDGNGVIDRMEEVKTWTDQSGHSNTDTTNYQLTWTDEVHWTANAEHELLFGTPVDTSGRPVTLIMNGGEQTIHWLTTVSNGVLATIASSYDNVSALLTIIDTDNDGKPDHFNYSEVTGGLTILTAAGQLVNYTSAAITALIETSSDQNDVFSGVAFSSSSNPTTILLPSFNDVSNITINTTGNVGGTPLSGESYYTFHSGTGVVAAVGDNGFSLNLTNDNDNNPLTFNASWSWLNSSGQISQTSSGVLTFQDTDASKTGPEQWSVTFNKVNTGALVADGTDQDALPDGFVVGDDMGNDVSVPLVWQPKDGNNVIATFTATVKDSNNSDITFSGVLKDTNSDSKPDTIAGTWGAEAFNLPFSFTDTNSDGTPDHWRMVESQTQSGRVQVDASGNPAGLYLNNSMTFDLGITGATLTSDAIVVKLATANGGMSTVNVSVASLTFDGSHLTVPLSGTDYLTNQSYHLYPSSGADIFVKLPGVVVGQQTAIVIVKAWQVGNMNNNSYSLSPMTVVGSGSGTNGADWVTGTSGNDTIAAGAGNDVIQWSGGYDTVDAGDGYDKLYLSFSTSGFSRELDVDGVLHIETGITSGGAAGGLTGGVTGGLTGTTSILSGGSQIIVDAFRIIKLSADSYQIQEMSADGLTVTGTMLLNNAEFIAAGSQTFQLKIASGGGQYVSGTPWDDQINIDAASLGNLQGVSGDTGKDLLVLDLGAGYSSFEVVKSGISYLLKGTLISSGTVVELGRVTPPQSPSGNGATMTMGTGTTAKSFMVYDIELFRFVSGSVIFDVDPSQFADVSFYGNSFQNSINGTSNADTIDADALASANNAKTHNDWIYGNGGADSINAGTGDDYIDGGAGNDTIDGGAGKDTASFQGNKSGYTVTNGTDVGGKYLEVTNNTTSEVDKLYNIEALQFWDGRQELSVTFNAAYDSNNWSNNTINGTSQADEIDADALAAANPYKGSKWLNINFAQGPTGSQTTYELGAKDFANNGTVSFTDVELQNLANSGLQLQHNGVSVSTHFTVAATDIIT